ncbi:hypothetical protein LINPERHAP1_LOCUS10600 [Linum perenne]
MWMATYWSLYKPWSLLFMWYSGWRCTRFLDRSKRKRALDWCPSWCIYLDITCVLCYLLH